MKRKSSFAPDLRTIICDRLAGGESLRAICRTEGFPTEALVRQWVMADDAGFASHYTRAREIGYARMEEEIVVISDDGTGDSWVDDEGVVRTNSDVIARSKLRVDTRKWILAKMLPKVYGDRVELNHSGQIDLASRIASARERTGKT